MATYDYDLFVIGAGSGGVRASRIASGHGAKVAVAEDDRLGGTCVNVGCVPKKLFVYASHFSHDFEHANGFGWTVGQKSFDWQALIKNKDTEINRLNGIYDRMLKGAGVELISGRATIVDKNTVAVGDKNYSCKYILVAPGGTPMVPDIEGKEHVVTSNEMFYLTELPKDMIIVGGGYIAVEFACIMQGLGVNVTQQYRGELFLRGFDDEVRTHLAGEVRKLGVDLQFGTNISKVEKLDNGRYRCTLEGDKGTVETGLVMYATGRIPKTEGLGLDKAGVKQSRNGGIVVDEYSKTNVDNIYAVGDVTNRVALTPVAIAEGHCFADTVFNNNPRMPNHDDIPTAVFSQPPIGTVGLSEADARKKYGALDVYTSTFRPMKHTLSGSDEKSFFKCIVDRASDRVVGVHIVGPDAGELIQGIGIAVKCGATKKQFDSTIGVHPTSAEELVTMRTPTRRDPLPEES